MRTSFFTFLLARTTIFAGMSEISASAGIAVFPAGVDDFYNISLVLISHPIGHFIGNRSTTAPVNIASFTETVRSMIFSTVSQSATIATYFISLPPAFPPDWYYDVFNAVRALELIDEYRNHHTLPLNHGEAYTMSLPEGKTTTLLALDLSSPKHLYATSLSSIKQVDKKRVNTISRELSMVWVDDKTLKHALERILLSPEGNLNLPEQIAIIKSTSSPKDCDKIVADVCPNVPIKTLAPEDIAQGAASFANTNLIINKKWRVCAAYHLPMSVSVATASGAAVPIAEYWVPIPQEFYVTFTNSVDNQKSATIRLMLGSHKQAKNNLERAVVVLNDLKPLQKGQARIKVLIKVSDNERWREAVQIFLEQKDGPKKAFLIPRFLADLPKDDELYNIKAKVEKTDDLWEQSDEDVVGKLPE